MRPSAAAAFLLVALAFTSALAVSRFPGVAPEPDDVVTTGEPT